MSRLLLTFAAAAAAFGGVHAPLASGASPKPSCALGGASVHGCYRPRAGSARATVKVTSTLDGRSVLPRRIKWVASVNLPQSQVSLVGFLIDGKPKWFTERVPATFNGDGYLVTTWLSPGVHSFTVRLHTKDHRVIDDTVTARVVAAAGPPAALAGAWQRTINGADAPANPANRVPPSGRYELIFDKRWIADAAPGHVQLQHLQEHRGGVDRRQRLDARDVVIPGPRRRHHQDAGGHRPRGASVL